MRNQEGLALTRENWLPILSGDADALTFQILRGTAYLRATADETEPTERDGLRYGPGEGEDNASLRDLFPGIPVKQVWARAITTPASILVTHAAPRMFEGHRGAELAAPAAGGAMLTARDELIDPVPRAIFVGSGGTLVCELVDTPGVELTFQMVGAGETLALRVSKILSASTVNNIVGLY